MTLTERINLLVEKADKLRPLHEDDPAKLPLGKLVDEINAMRAVQAVPGYVETPDEPIPDPVCGKPGRKPKAAE